MSGEADVAAPKALNQMANSGGADTDWSMRDTNSSATLVKSSEFDRSRLLGPCQS